MLNPSKYIKDTRWWWIIAAVSLVLLRSLLPASWIELGYSRGIYPVYRSIWDAVANISPIPVIYIVLSSALIWGVRKIISFWKWEAPKSQKLGSALLTTVAFLGFVLTIFMLVWGFNYKRVRLATQLDLTASPLSKAELKAELDLVTAQLISARNAINQDTFPTQIQDINHEFLNENLEELLIQWQYPTNGKVTIRELAPKGNLLRIGTSGVYLPWAGEGHIDAGLHSLQKPFTITHEMAHGYGFTDEGTCNFVAYVACLQSGNPHYVYSGYYGLWKYLAINYAAYDIEDYRAYLKTLPRGLINDIKAVRANSAQYPDLFPKFRDAFYDTYLKTQGIPDGMLNYSNVIMLAKAWREQGE